MGVSDKMATEAPDERPAISLGVDETETEVEVRSISPSGLAVLCIADPRGVLRPLLESKLDEQVRLTATAKLERVSLTASLVWFESAEASDPSGSTLELFVDGSASADWGRLLALSRMPR